MWGSAKAQSESGPQAAENSPSGSLEMTGDHGTDTLSTELTEQRPTE